MRVAQLPLLLATGLFFLLLAGCDISKIDGSKVIVVWTGWQNEASVLTELAKEFTEITGTQVKVVNVSFVDLKNKFQLAAPAFVGPDIITGPNDWIGPFAIANLIQPVSFVSDQYEILPVGLKSMGYKNLIFGFPLFMEGVAFIYNKSLIPAPPLTMGDAIKMSKDFRSKDQYGLVFDISNFYFTWPFFSGWGATVFQAGTENNLAPKPSLSEHNAVIAGEYLRQIIEKEGLFPAVMTGDVANALFLDGRAAMIINGPWFIEDVRKSGINFGIAKIPMLANGNHPASFVGVQGLYLNKRTLNKDKSLAFIDFLGEPKNIVKLATASGRIPVDKRALAMLKDNEVITGYSKALTDGMPLPNIPAMTQVWPYMSEGMKLIVQKEHDVADILKTSNEQINEAIKRLVK